MIKRLITDELIKSLLKYPSVGITGPRQVGKTTLAKQLIKSNKKQSIYLDLELKSDAEKLRDPEIFLKENRDKCVVLDEVQRMPQLFPLFRALIDQYKTKGRFVLLGSISPDLMVKYSSESLAGRIRFVELTPFNLTEVNKYGIKKHWARGGFPQEFLNPSNTWADKWQEDFVNTYIERDLTILGLKFDPESMRRLWQMIAALSSSTLNINLLSKSLGLQNAAIKNYIYFLKNAYIINLLQPYHINIKKRLIKAPKIYIRDSGILHHLVKVNNFSDLLNHPSIGASWEGYVIEQIRQLSAGKFQTYYFRTQAGAEIDLVLERGGKPVAAIEIKFSKSPGLSKGNINSINDLKTEQNFVIGFDVDDYLIRKDIRICSLESFLTKYLPLI